MLTYVLATMRRPGADTTVGGSPATVKGRGGPPPPPQATARQDGANLPLLVLGYGGATNPSLSKRAAMAPELAEEGRTRLAVCREELRATKGSREGG